MKYIGCLLLLVSLGWSSDIGHISVPRVGISSSILEGVNKNILAISVGHVSETTFPGDFGNVVLAAHRTSFFRGLKNIRIGDKIILKSYKGIQYYQVRFIFVVNEKNITVLKDTGQSMLTLITCYPFYGKVSTQRLIVQAFPI